MENVREPLLRWELKKQADMHPSATFIDIRDLAIKWSTETDGGSRRRVRIASQEISTAREDGVCLCA